MSENRIVRTEKTVRGPFGQVVKWVFILFNILMLVWMVSTCASVGETINSAGSDAEQAGTAIGGTLATGMLLFIWGFGDIILGMFVLFTRGKKVIVEETRG